MSHIRIDDRTHWFQCITAIALNTDPPLPFAPYAHIILGPPYYVDAEIWAMVPQAETGPPKPSWPEIIAGFGEWIRSEAQAPMLASLDQAYVEQIRHIIPEARYKYQLPYLIAAMRRRGRSDQADLVQAWADHLFERYSEFRAAIAAMGDDWTISMYTTFTGFATGSRPRRYIWDTNEAWSAPFWSPRPEMPDFDKPDLALPSVVVDHNEHPPSAVRVTVNDRNTLAIHSVGPAAVQLSDPSGQLWPAPLEFSFRRPGVEYHHAGFPDVPLDGAEIIVSWTAYGRDYSETITLSVPAFD